jgi:uncharacterized protein YbdZ (MbtH family)
MDTIMTLKQIRDRCEKGGEVKLVIFHEFYDSLYVILEFNNKYSLNRYFRFTTPAFVLWNCSIDISQETMQDCLDYLTEEFADYYPKE